MYVCCEEAEHGISFWKKPSWQRRKKGYSLSKLWNIFENVILILWAGKMIKELFLYLKEDNRMKKAMLAWAFFQLGNLFFPGEWNSWEYKHTTKTLLIRVKMSVSASHSIMEQVCILSCDTLEDYEHHTKHWLSWRRKCTCVFVQLPRSKFKVKYFGFSWRPHDLWLSYNFFTTFY